jgi:FkbM family methyltransferase
MFFISDQVRRNVLVTTDQGLMIVNRFDCNAEQVGHGQWLLDHGSASSVEAQTTFDFLRTRNISDPIIFDVGANIGTYTNWLARIFPAGKIYAFEPQRIIFQMLCGNAAINNFDNCFIHNMAISNTSGFLEITEPDYNKPEDFGIFSLVADKIFNKSGIKSLIPVMSLDDFVETYQVNHVDFVKIDVEGMDLQVLQGAEQTLKNHQPGIFIEHSDNIRSILIDIQEYLGSENYEFQVLGNNLLASPKRTLK